MRDILRAVFAEFRLVKRFELRIAAFEGQADLGFQDVAEHPQMHDAQGIVEQVMDDQRGRRQQLAELACLQGESANRASTSCQGP